MKKPYEMTRVHCKFCGYNNHTKNKLWVKCKWCGKRLSVKKDGAEKEMQIKEEARDALTTFQEVCKEANETLPTVEEFNEQMKAFFGIKQPGKVMKELWEKGDWQNGNNTDT